MCDNNMRYEIVYGYTHLGLGRYEVKMCKVCGYMDNEIYNFTVDKFLDKE